MAIVGYSTTTGRYEYRQLADADIPDAEISGAKLADGAVTTAKIASGAVDSDQINADAVQSYHIASGQVDTEQLAADAVTADEIADNAVLAAHIASGQVGSDEIAADAVTSVHIASGQVDTEQLAADAVTSDELADDAVLAAHIASGQVGTTELAADAVETVNVLDEAITEAKLASGISIDIAESLRDLTIPCSEPLSGGDCMHLASGGTLALCDATDATKMPSIGISPGSVASGDAAALFLNGRIQGAFLAHLSGDDGGLMYVSTAGKLTTTAPAASGNIQQKMGIHRVDDEVIIAPSSEMVELAI